MTYRALFTADWHLCNTLPHAKPGEAGVSDRLKDQVKVAGRISEIAIEHKVNAIYILGDLFDRRLLDAITLRCGVELIVDMAEVTKADVYILPGNHEAHSVSGERFATEVFEVIDNKRVHYLDTLIMPSRGAPCFHALPWGSTGVTLERLEHYRTCRVEGVQNVLLAHHPIVGCRDGTWECDVGLDAKTLCEGWDLVLAGHFHERQHFGDCGMYVGAPMQHDFGDAGSDTRGVEIIEFQDDSYSKTFVTVDSPRFFIYDWDEHVDSLERTGEAHRGDYVRVNVQSTHAEWVVRFAEAESWAKTWRDGGVHVEICHVPKYQHEQRLELGEAPTPEQVLSEYLEIAETEGLDTKRLLEIGKAALHEVSHG